MIPIHFLQKIGSFVFWAFVVLAVVGAIALFTLPADAKILRRVAAGAAYFFGLPAVLGLLVLAFDKLGWLKDPPKG